MQTVAGTTPFLGARGRSVSHPGTHRPDGEGTQRLPGSAQHPVILYTGTACPGSQHAREYLRAKGIPYVERNVDQDPAAAGELARRGAVATPVLIVNGRTLVGFDPDELQAAMGR